MIFIGRRRSIALLIRSGGGGDNIQKTAVIYILVTYSNDNSLQILSLKGYSFLPSSLPPSLSKPTTGELSLYLVNTAKMAYDTGDSRQEERRLWW